MNDGKPIDGYAVEGTTEITIDRRIYCGYCKKEITNILYIGLCGSLLHYDCWQEVKRKLKILLEADLDDK